MPGSLWYQAIRVNHDFHRISLVNKYIDENIKSTDSFIGRFFCPKKKKTQFRIICLLMFNFVFVLNVVYVAFCLL